MNNLKKITYLLFLLMLTTLLSSFFSSPRPRKKTAVLIHGCHLGAKDWPVIMFGDESQNGRVDTGIEEALKSKASLIIWGSGASKDERGFLESEYIFEKTLTTNLSKLAEQNAISPDQLKKYLIQKSLLLKEEKNTEQEVASAIKICRDHKIDNLILISSPTHIARCMQESCKFMAQNNFKDLAIYARASQTCYTNSCAHDVVIIEPPHRADYSKLPAHLFFKNAYSHF